MTTGLRVLVVTNALPYPPVWGSGVRTLQLARKVAERHSLTMLCRIQPWESESVEPLRAMVPDLHTIPVATSPRLRRKKQLRSLPSPVPFQCLELRGTPLQKGLDDLLKQQTFDLIQLEGSQLCGLTLPASTPVVLNEHNVEYEVLQRMKDGERSWSRRAYSGLEYLKCRSFERRSWRQVSACAVPSEREAEMVRAYAPETPTAVVPNAVDVDYFAPREVPAQADSIIFTGLLSYRPNLDAAFWLVEEILPAILRRRPDTRLVIVGDGEPSDLDALRRPGVTVTGRVDDVRPFVSAAGASVVPVRMGSGTRLKVLEALAMGKAVVTTALGCEGLPVKEGEHLLVSESDPQSFADSVVRVLDDEGLRRALGATGRSLVTSEYTWALAAAQMDELYERALGSSGAGAEVEPIAGTGLR